MNRIDQKFIELKKAKRKAFIAFITAGDPDLKTTEALVLGFEKAGVDIIELGVPFSDPMADGPTIQASSMRALKHHVNIADILKLVSRLRARTQIPIVLMPYYNPVFHYGVTRFVKDSSAAGVDGVIIPDLPPEEAGELMAAAKKSDFATIFLAAPTTTDARLPKIVRASQGFIYYVSLTGVTGVRKDIPVDFKRDIGRIKSITAKPVCVGFGISTPEQVKAVAAAADGIIVGSAIVRCIEQNIGNKNIVQNVCRSVARLTSALK